jgi:hypothetical protein
MFDIVVPLPSDIPQKRLKGDFNTGTKVYKTNSHLYTFVVCF